MGVEQITAQDRKAQILAEDEHKLASMGYKQELNRAMSAFAAFGFCLAVVSPLMGVTGLFIIGWGNGGPVALVYGWLIVSFFVTMIALSMGEICSSFPTTGGLYFWAARLGGRHSRFFAWLTGWLNLLGLVASLSSVSYVGANFITIMVLLATGQYLTQPQQLGVFAALLVSQAFLNTVGVGLLSVMGHVATYWQLGGMLTMIIGLPIIAPKHQPAKFVFTEFMPNLEFSGLPNGGYAFMVSLLTGAWSISGYDTAPHMCEETMNAQLAGAWGVVGAVVSSAVFGFIYLLVLLFSIQDVDNLLGNAANTATLGFMPPAQIMYDACQARFGGNAGRNGALLLMTLPLVAAYLSGVGSLTSASRMMFAFSRDGSLPGSHLWHQLHPRFRVPVNAVWCCTLLAFLLALPMVYSAFAFNAVTSVATIAASASYGLPIFLRWTFGRKDFVPGPFNLGKFGVPVAVLASCWVATVVVIFVLPQFYPVDMLVNANYAPIAFGAVLLFCLGWWFLGARTWFTGPVRQTEAFVDGANDMGADGMADSQKV